MPRLSPPTAMGLPRKHASAACSTGAKKASVSRWAMVRICTAGMIYHGGSGRIRGVPHFGFQFQVDRCRSFLGMEARQASHRTSM